MRPPNKYGCRVDHGTCKVHSLPTVGWWGCEKSSRKRDPVVGDIYSNAVEHRRVLHVGSADMKFYGDDNEVRERHVTRVCYSNGGDHNHWCSLDTFRSWFSQATLDKDGHDRSTGTAHGS